MAEAADRLFDLSEHVRQGAIALLDMEWIRLAEIRNSIPELVRRKLTEERFTLFSIRKDLSQGISGLLTYHRHRLELLGQRIADASPQKLLSRGYSITLREGKAVTDASQLKAGDCLITRLAKGSVQSIVVEGIKLVSNRSEKR
ncbi:exodeoxyribonuclease VII large subunit [Bacteroides pyogenes DSM 20611 = JCM 6294]|nr:exodeoxyribonuclease VII large subunit [Bacteroides pyogenes DSM 20611 = JCM 6294]